ncbi:YqaJ viral recombinase family protein [Amycolatopsis sp. WAC 01375]|uniref:YqaJ viral recombinase family nuclease n=1 Tax=Amycolatopsis sp. WAC 01375 TaxID=2203194 RepID=UPI001315882D|nr:YqaJ viral recombinase family protein [Amycolatopsis sp. WAC 01375]
MTAPPIAPPTPRSTAPPPGPSWTCPAGKLVLPASASHAQWLARRRDGLGASDASTVGGVNPWSDLTRLYADKVHGISVPDNDKMRVGRDLEGYVLARFREATGLQTRRVGMLASREHPWMLASLDGLSSDGGLVEAKTTTSEYLDQWTDARGNDSLPSHYLLQVQWQLKVSGRTQGWIACLFLDTRKFVYRRVERDDELIALLVELGGDFWHDHVLPQVAPPLDAGAGPILRLLHPTVGVTSCEGGNAAAVALRRQARIKAQIKELEAELDGVMAELFAITGEAETLTVHGMPAATWRHTGRFDQDAWRAATDPDIVRAFTRTQDVIDWRAVVAERPADARFRARVFLPKQNFA